MKRFKVFDVYDFNAFCIGYADTLAEVKRLAREEYDETDGECTIYYLEFDPVTKKYPRESAKFLATI